MNAADGAVHLTGGSCNVRNAHACAFWRQTAELTHAITHCIAIDICDAHAPYHVGRNRAIMAVLSDPIFI